MTIEKIGLDFDKLENITMPDFGINGSGSKMIDKAVESANLSTNNKLGFGILGSLWFILYWVLNDKTQLGDFGYSNLQAIVLSFSICSTIGIVLLQLNIIYSFFSVSLFIVFYVIFFIIILIIENKR